MPFSYLASVTANKGGGAPATGVLYTAGYNLYGQLGDGTTVDKSTLTTIGSGFTNVAVGYVVALALKNGQLWAWGYNNLGALGTGDTTDRSSPVQVGAASDWFFLHTERTDSEGHSAGIRTAGTYGALYTWGQNDPYGSLGLGDITNRSSPVQVGTHTDWWMVSMGFGNTMGIRVVANDAGTLWGWGYNTFGQLGLNNTTNYSSPVQVGTRTDWQVVSCGDAHGLGLTANGFSRELWAWGDNWGGQLGTGDTYAYSSPVQIGAGTDWYFVSAGAGHSMAIKTDGTLWTWGYNSSGQLGLGDMTDRSSPVQVGTDTDWAWVSGGFENSMAQKQDGTIWVWGANSYGEFADGTVNYYSSPIQVGSFTNYAIPQENFVMPIHSLAGDNLAVIRDET